MLSRVTLLATIFLLLALAAPARGDAYFVPLDGSDKRSTPADFGYKVETTTAGKKVTIRLRLNEAALKAFQSGNLTLMSRKKQLPDVPLKVVRAPGGKGGAITVVFDRGKAEGGLIVIWSDMVKNAPPRINFGGFSLHIEELLKRATKVEP